MVISDCEERKTSEYSLDAVHLFAKSNKLIYKSPKVQQDIENLGFSLDIVCQCLQSLGEQHYYKSVNYANKQGWFDVYRRSWSVDSQSGVLDSLYIKFKLNLGRGMIILASFHR